MNENLTSTIVHVVRVVSILNEEQIPTGIN
jgi:hypothetical protein